MAYDKQTEEYFEALKLLDIASELAHKIKNEEVKVSVLGELVSCKECFYSLFNKKNFAEMAEKAVFLHENMGEILADCDDQDNLKIAIDACIANMAEQFMD